MATPETSRRAHLDGTPAAWLAIPPGGGHWGPYHRGTAGIWELRLNQGRGSGAAYNRLYGAINLLDLAIDEMDRRGVRYAVCDSP